VPATNNLVERDGGDEVWKIKHSLLAPSLIERAFVAAVSFAEVVCGGRSVRPEDGHVIIAARMPLDLGPDPLTDAYVAGRHVDEPGWQSESGLLVEFNQRHGVGEFVPVPGDGGPVDHNKAEHLSGTGHRLERSVCPAGRASLQCGL
jgi:hypothetical protein